MADARRRRRIRPARKARDPRPTRPSLPISRLICRAPARSSAPAPTRRCCNAAKRRCSRRWARRRPRSDRKPIISTSRRPAATRAPSCRRWPSGWASRPTRSPPSATCRTIWRCSAKSGLSIAMGNATDDVKKARHPCHDVECGRRLCQGDRVYLERQCAIADRSSRSLACGIRGCPRCKTNPCLPEPAVAG